MQRRKGEKREGGKNEQGESRRRGRREFSELLLEPEKSFLPLKSSRCGLRKKRRQGDGDKSTGREEDLSTPWSSAYTPIRLQSMLQN